MNYKDREKDLMEKMSTPEGREYLLKSIWFPIERKMYYEPYSNPSRIIMLPEEKEEVENKKGNK